MSIQITLWSWTIGESLLILLPHLGIQAPSWVPQILVGATPNLDLKPIFLLSALLTTTGGWIRAQCFRALGRLFTFEITIRKDHRLVTNGPYSIVRHPSYTGSLIMGAGMVLLAIDEFYGSKNTFARGLLASSWILYGMFWVGLTRRTGIEDAMMKKEFGKEWVDWSKRVPYRVFPYLF